MEQMQDVDTYEDTPHPDDWLKVEKLIDGEWVTTGWAPNEKAFMSHADAVGGSVRAAKTEAGSEVFYRTEYAAFSDLDIDKFENLCDNECLEHS